LKQQQVLLKNIYNRINPQAFKNHIEEIERLRNEIRQLFQETDFTKLQTGYRNLTAEVSAFKGEIRSLGEEGRTVFGELGNDLKKQFEWLTSGTLLFGTISTIKEMADNVNDLNKAMTNVRIASGASASEAQEMMNIYNQMARELGATTVEVTNSADAFLRQGKTVQETNELIKDSMMLSKLGEIDSAQATDYLTARIYVCTCRSCWS
jgi:methyl-accepting chemotaxis protein